MTTLGKKIEKVLNKSLSQCTNVQNKYKLTLFIEKIKSLQLHLQKGKRERLEQVSCGICKDIFVIVFKIEVFFISAY